MTRRRSGLAPTLFPFLAVLVCTLGTLILFLALVAQNATEAAQQEAAQAAVATSSDDAGRHPDLADRLTSERAELLIAEGKYRVDQLVSHRTKQTSELEEKRDQLTHLEDHLQRIKEQLKRLRDEVESATSGVQDGGPKTDDLVLLQQEIEAEREQFKVLESEHQKREPRIVIVPHQGPNGTDRRPIYLECTAGGLIVWPEGAAIPLAQLDAASPAANPLDSALRVIRHHALQHYQDTIPPYPLLIVRPGGIDTYAAARRAMQDWDDQFGYELVPSETKLAFPKPDPALRERIDVAIREAVRGQRALQRFVGGPGGRGFPAGGPAPVGAAWEAGAGVDIGSGSDWGPEGDVGSTAQPGPPRPLPNLSAAKLDQMARSSGFRAAGSFDAASVNDPVGGRSSRILSGQSAFPGRSSEGLGMDGSSPDSPNAATRELDRRLREASADPATRASSGGDPTLLAESNVDLTLKGATTREATTRGELGEPSQGAESGSPESQAGDASRRGEQSSSAGGGQQSIGSSTSGPPPSEQMNHAEGTSSSISGMNTPPPQSADPRDTPMPNSANVSSTESAEAPRSDMVRRQGQNWGLPDHMAGIHGTAVIRTLRIICYPDRYVLLPPSNGGATEMFGLTDGDSQRATLELATAVRDRVARWGAPLPGGRWQPRLDVEVAPQAETRFEQLRHFMSGSGVEVRYVSPAGSGPR